MKILLVEDDQPTGELLSNTLTAHRYTVDLALDGQTGLELAILWKYDLIVLDIQIPKVDGISVCRQLRARGDMTPILILTAQDSNDNIITGLDAGADDYVAKPCEPSQLLARIRALLRRGSKVAASPLLTWGELCLDPASVQVTYEQQSVTLSPKEYSLLELFLRYPQRIFSRNAIIDQLWKIDDYPSEHAVTNLIKDLRRQLKAAGMKQELIETVYGLGYRVKTPPYPALGDREESLAQDKGELNQETTTQKGEVAIEQIRERFRTTLDRRIGVLEEAVWILQDGGLSLEQRKTAREEAHRLVGSLGTFGYAKGSDLARTIEHLLLRDGMPPEKQVTQLSQLLLELKRELAQPPILPKIGAKVTPYPLILLISQDAEFGQRLRQEAAGWELQLEVVSTQAAIVNQFPQITPAAILLDSDDSMPVDNRFSLARTLKQQFPAACLFILTEQSSLAHRVRIARLGGRYLSKSTAPAQVFGITNRLLPHTQLPNAKVMVVDDDPLALATLTQLLQPWGVQVTCLSKPGEFWDVLTATQPDLLLLDVEMPIFNGIELCQVVRQDPIYGDLPILVITAHMDTVAIQQIFAAGADDLIGKPIVGSELVSRVIGQLEQSRLRQQLDDLRYQQTQTGQQQTKIDALTQLSTRCVFDAMLKREWQRLMQEQQPLALILCDVDHFKHYNDCYGYAAGNACLKQIAGAIQKCINPFTDRGARYGGEEIGIILPGTTLNGALCVAERIQTSISRLQIPHEASTISPYVTISMGITGSIPRLDQSVDALLNVADQALQAAKRRGRNTYCLYPL